ncbi:MAG: PD-(D/E)XK nuclease family protein [Ilumatobacteraceae bacterium]|nr:PD-(D/E)XK nuclease family protein [Ilumatobacteraceae bacterium]
MAVTHTLITAAQAPHALAQAVAMLQAGDPLAPVTLLAPNAMSGVMARRALGRTGVAGIDAPTIGRLAGELAAGHPMLAGRVAASNPVLEQVLADALREQPGELGNAALHPTSVRAVRAAYRELRIAGPDAARRLVAGIPQAASLAGTINDAHDRLSTAWYDEADALAAATDAVRTGQRTPQPMVVYLVEALDGRAIELVAAIGAATDVHLVITAAATDLADRLASTTMGGDATGAAIASPEPIIISTTDADDECRWAARSVVRLARDGVPLDRIAVVWPTLVPYARLLVHHLEAAGIAWNGRGGTPLHERVAPRVLLDLLDLGRHGVRRRELFAMLAGAPIHSREALAPTTEWERIARLAGVVGPDDWHDRLDPYLDDPRWGTAAASLLEFVGQLENALDDRVRTWSEWTQWARAEVTRLLGADYRSHLAEPEVRADEALDLALQHITDLDQLDAARPVSRARFALALAGEVDDAPTTEGRVGHGVTVCSLHGTLGIDVDAAVVVGAADTTLPPRPTPDPVLDDRRRLAAGLPTSDDHTRQLRRRFDELVERCAVTITAPRGDLRHTAERTPSPWIRPWFGEQARHVASATGGLLTVDFPASPAEHRWRTVLARQRSGTTLDDLGADIDPITRRGAELTSARAAAQLTEFDGDLSAVSLPSLTAHAPPLSPSRLEQWARCPHAYFVRHLLGVSALDEVGGNLHLQPVDRGTALHAALDRFHRAVLAGDLPQPGPTGWGDEHCDALLDAFDAVCADLERRGRVGRPASWADRRDEMRNDLLGWLVTDGALVAARRSHIAGSEVVFDEASIELTGERRLRVHGTIDRIDRATDGAVIVTDHKTGSDRDLRGLDNDDPTLGGRRFQLATYAAAAAQWSQSDAPVRAEYGFFVRNDYRRIGIDFDDPTMMRATDAIAHTVDGIEAGWFPHHPARPGWRLYVDCPYCEPDGLGTGELHRAWLHKRHDERAGRWFAPPDPIVEDTDDR